MGCTARVYLRLCVDTSKIHLAFFNQWNVAYTYKNTFFFFFTDLYSVQIYAPVCTGPLKTKGCIYISKKERLKENSKGTWTHQYTALPNQQKTKYLPTVKLA